LYFYQYDAWNRLIQVSQAQEPNPAPIPGTGTTGLAIGAMVKHHTYDGVGRLVRTQSPWPNAESATGSNRSERFFYDGVRRI